jgi:glycosyltransferase involved in cell wall biosynthesis
MEKRSFSKADDLIAVSDFVGKETLNLLGLNHKTYTVIYNPVDVDKFYQSNAKNIEEHAIFFAGTLVEKKGIRQLVESLNYLVDDFPKLKLYVAGRDANLPGTNIPYRPILDKAITKKVEGHIEFLGVIPNDKIPDYIAKSQVCCYPSHMEAMPLAWLEVMAMGKILIGGSTGPGPEAIIDGVTGFLVDPTDPKAIADKIRFVLNNYESCAKIGQNGFERVRKEFDVGVIVDKNINFYKKIIQST